MEQKDKDLLLKYLSMALPYGVIIQHPDLFWSSAIVIEKLVGIDKGYINDDGMLIENVKPYLRSLSSMTEEEMDTYANTGSFLYANGIPYNLIYTTEGLIFLLNNHFDIFNLIPKDLAIEVTEENNPYRIAK